MTIQSPAGNSRTSTTKPGRSPAGSSPRVLAVVGNLSACEGYRIFSPFSHLVKLGYQTAWATCAQAAQIDIDQWDVVVLPRLGLLEMDKIEVFFADLHGRGKVVVYETDDDLTRIPDWNPSKMDEEHVRGIVEMMRRCDLVTVSTHHLASQLRQYNPKIVVLPNCVDPDVWSFPREGVRKVEGLTVGVHGGNSHLKDWEILAEVWPVLAQRYPEVKFVVAGYHPPYFDELGLGERLVKIGWVPLGSHPAVVYQIDIGCCPLNNDVFSRSKSPVKWMESAMVGAPCVVSPTVYGNYVQHGATGFVARTKQEWIRYLERLIQKPRLRQEIGRAARGHVLTHLNIHDKASLWMQAYRKAWQETRSRTRA